jgi:hypothetical protein
VIERLKNMFHGITLYNSFKTHINKINHKQNDFTN